ncbi:hypothetical protein [Tahibacter amnicola]|uniref:Uncharacterized protein n=1 Tax=Tahibacter amnicola TaxID=2976241 RepID=A0ABY6BFG2_9GAMM|nr:hypothetical protein [Tahibacter amnicola]UXI68499.1 hypothetical protein N4264_02265 [Tahibacter amnicola]
MTHALPHSRRCLRHGLALVALLIGGSIGMTAMAAVETTATAPAPAPTATDMQPAPQDLGELDEIDRISRKQAHKQQKLRCWQEGKLIVEREVDPASAEAYRSVELTDPQKQPMRLYDLRNATCLIQ